MVVEKKDRWDAGEEGNGDVAEAPAISGEQQGNVTRSFGGKVWDRPSGSCWRRIVDALPSGRLDLPLLGGVSCKDSFAGQGGGCKVASHCATSGKISCSPYVGTTPCCCK